jgi:tetratricopeptide (TPR) repeat protein
MDETGCAKEESMRGAEAFRVALVSLIALLAVRGVCRAQESAARGDALLAGGNFAEAGATYRRAYDETHDPAFCRKAAQAYLKLVPPGRAQALEAATVCARQARTIDEAHNAQALVAELQAVPTPPAAAPRTGEPVVVPSTVSAHATSGTGPSPSKNPSGPLDAQARIDASVKLRMEGRMAEALVEANKAIDLDPRCSRAYVNRAVTQRQLNQLDQALADNNRAVELDANSASAYDDRAATQAALGESAKAVADATRAIELDPKFAGAYESRATAYLDGGQPDKAISDASSAIKLNPDFGMAYLVRGLAYLSADRAAEALPDANKAVQIFGRQGIAARLAMAHGLRAKVYLSVDEYAGALADFNKSIELNPEAAEPYSGRGGTLLLLGRDVEAEADFRKAVSLGADPARINELRAAVKAARTTQPKR